MLVNAAQLYAVGEFTHVNGVDQEKVARFTDTTVQPDFTLSATPVSQTVGQGSTTSYDLSVAPSGGFSGTVTFSVSGLPAGATANFNPTSVTTSGSSTMTVSTSVSTPVGSYPLDIVATSGSLVHSVRVSLVVSGSTNFSISASPSSRTVSRGSSTTYTVTIAGSGGFSGTVTLSLSGLPPKTSEAASTRRR